MSRKERGRTLASIKGCTEASIKGIEKYTKKGNKKLIKESSNNNDDKMIYSKTGKFSKHKWEEKQLQATKWGDCTREDTDMANKGETSREKVNLF